MTTEKRLILDVREARGAYQNGEISYVGWRRSIHNLADGFKKLDKSGLMVECFERGKLETKLEQWVIRKDVEGMENEPEDDENTE